MKVTLTDQMGAMASVDAIRHRRMAISELLDLPRRREEVANRLREYYASKSIDVDDVVIEQGVHEYFSRRLVFEAPEVNKFKRALSSLYVIRSVWLPNAGIAIFSFFVVAVVVMYGSNLIDKNHTENVELMAADYASSYDRVEKEMIRFEAEADTLENRAKALKLTSAQRFVSRARESLAVSKKTIPQRAKFVVSKDSRDAIESDIGVKGVELNKAVVSLNAVAAILADASNLLDAKESLNAILKSDDFAGLIGKYPSIKSLSASAQSSIDRANTGGDVGTARNSVAALQTAISSAPNMDSLLDRHNKAVAAFDAMNLDVNDKKIVSSMSAIAMSAISKIDQAAAQDAVIKMEESLDFAGLELEINIVDRVGEKSGVERNYNETNGKSWFLVAEAISPSGEVIPVPVKSSETGEFRYARIFGVRVSNDEYGRVKQDKKSDGHIDDVLIGTKPLNSLSMKFGNRTTAQPEIILEW